MGAIRTRTERLEQLVPDPTGQPDGLAIVTQSHIDARGIRQYGYDLGSVSGGIPVNVTRRGPGCGFTNGGLLLTGTIEIAVEVPYAFAGTGWTIVLSASGNASIVVSHSTYAAYNTMSTLFTATVTGAIKNQATGLSYSLAAGDILKFSGSGFSGAVWAAITLDGTAS